MYSAHYDDWGFFLPDYVSTSKDDAKIEITKLCYRARLIAEAPSLKNATSFYSLFNRAPVIGLRGRRRRPILCIFRRYIAQIAAFRISVRVIDFPAVASEISPAPDIPI